MSEIAVGVSGYGIGADNSQGLRIRDSIEARYFFSYLFFFLLCIPNLTFPNAPKEIKNSQVACA